MTTLIRRLRSVLDGTLIAAPFENIVASRHYQHASQCSPQRLAPELSHTPYAMIGVTQCYLPPGRADIPALTPAEAGTRFSDPGGMQG